MVPYWLTVPLGCYLLPNSTIDVFVDNGRANLKYHDTVISARGAILPPSVRPICIAALPS